MQNPFRSEEDAFRFVWLTIGYFALIIVGWVIDVWLGVAVFVVLTVGLVWFFVFRDRRQGPPVRRTPAASPPDEHRILVIANETVAGAELRGAVRERAGGREVHVLVV